MWGIHRDRWIPCTKDQLRGKCFHLMTSSCKGPVMWKAFPCHDVFTVPDKKVKSILKKLSLSVTWCHCSDVTMSAMASQITGVLIIQSTILFRRRSMKTSKLRVTGLCEGNSPFIGPVTRKMFPFGKAIIWYLSFWLQVNYVPNTNRKY